MITPVKYFLRAVFSYVLSRCRWRTQSTTDAVAHPPAITHPMYISVVLCRKRSRMLGVGFTSQEVVTLPPLGLGRVTAWSPHNSLTLVVSSSSLPGIVGIQLRFTRRAEAQAMKPLEHSRTCRFFTVKRRSSGSSCRCVRQPGAELQQLQRIGLRLRTFAVPACFN